MITVLFTTVVCLLALHYLKLYPSFIAAFRSTPSWLNEARQSGWLGLLAYAWWGFWHLCLYVVVPVVVWRWLLKRPLRELGVGWGETHRYLGWYALLAAPIVLFAWLASTRPDFQQQYPFYALAGRSWLDFLLWEAIYISQFVALEFFFRGFLLHSLQPRFGQLAIWVMIIPYTMIHLPKPWLEASGAIFFGLFLGMLALASRSIWGGAMVHVSIALSMDLFALMRTDRWPGGFWPQ